MKKVLIIEDDRELNQAYADSLKRERYVVFCAASGGDGLILAEENRPDLILLDLMLPDMPGEKVLMLLKAGATTENIPVVVMSNKAEEASRNNCLEVLGAAGYLVKVDASIKDILDAVRFHLRKKPKN